MEILTQGAESRIYLTHYLGREMLVKERFKKNYRIPELDQHLSNERINAEYRNIVRSKEAGVKTPTLYHIDFNKRLIYMEYFANSVTVREYIQRKQENHTGNDPNLITPDDSINTLASTIGETIAKMHNCNIIHGDLTTSNMLLINGGVTVKDLVMIDFGLSHSKASIEDKGVDLYVLERSLLSTHTGTEEIFKILLESYRHRYTTKGNEVLKKLDEVRARGRKRTMVG